MSGADQFREAKKRGKATTGGAKASRYAKAPQAEYRGYVSYPRSAAQKAQFEAWVGETADISDAMDAAAEMGFKLSVSFDSKDGSYRGQWYSADASRSDAGLAVGVFTDSAWEAIALATFFLAVCGGFRLDGDFFSPPDVAEKRSFWT